MNGCSNMNKIISAALLLFVLFTSNSCKDPMSPGLEYMPDMYRTPAIKAYVDYLYPDSLMVRKPVQGTIPYATGSEAPNRIGSEKTYNLLPYPYPNTPEGYEAAGANLKNPIPLNEITLSEGKGLFINYCMMCHGEQGKGDGTLVKREKFPPPPSYSGPLKELPEGKMFHSIAYGKGLMGPHASLLSKTERWKIVHYVQQLQKIE